MRAGSRVIAGVVLSLLAGATVMAADVVHDAEYYILESQNGERWEAEDRKIDAKLAELEAAGAGNDNPSG